VVRHIFQLLVRCGYTLRVTSKASYSPEYITPTQLLIKFLNHNRERFVITRQVVPYANAALYEMDFFMKSVLGLFK
jgi:hypothetical protein